MTTTISPAKFFIPGAKRSEVEAAYDKLKSGVTYQMGWTASPRRIQSLTYTSGKHELTANVGDFPPAEHHFQVVAILEAALYVVLTVSKTGEPGPMILVDTKDVISLSEFAPTAGSVKSVPAVA